MVYVGLHCAVDPTVQIMQKNCTLNYCNIRFIITERVSFSGTHLYSIWHPLVPRMRAWCTGTV